MNARTLSETCCRTTPAPIAFWGVAFVVAYGAAIVAGSLWPAVGHYGDTIILASLGGACSVNFARNGRFIAACQALSSFWARWWQPRWRQVSGTWICVSSGALCSSRLLAHCSSSGGR
jgi:hypothetical protein